MKRLLDTGRIYRDTVRHKVSGVCAGVAKHFEVDPWIVRAVTVGCFIFMPVVVGLAYLLAVVLLPTRDY